MDTLVNKLDNLLKFVGHEIIEPLCDPLYGYEPTDDEKSSAYLSTRSLKAQIQPRPVIIDCGTASTKIGFAGNTLPTLVVPNLVCRQTPNSIKCFVGDDAIDRIGHNYHMSNPVRRGVVTNFSDMTEIWKYAFDKMNTHPHNRCVILTQSPLVGDLGRKQLLEALFEGLDVRGVMLVNEALMTLHASGRTTGIVLDVGEEVSYAVPIIDDVIQYHAIQSISMGGKDVTDYLVLLLQQRYSMTFDDDKRSAEQIKKIYGYVALNIGFERDVYQQVPTEDEFILVNGQHVQIGPERFECPELLFEPLIVGKECVSLQKLVIDAIQACGVEYRDDLFQNIVASGGTTMFDGFGMRLRDEIRLITGTKKAVRVVTPCERQFGAWFGASILGMKHSDAKDEFWVSEQEYFSKNADEILEKMA